MELTHSIPERSNEIPPLFISLIRIPQEDLDNPELSEFFQNDISESELFNGSVAMTLLHPVIFAGLMAKAVLDIPNERFMISKIMSQDFSVNYLFTDFSTDKPPLKFDEETISAVNISLLSSLLRVNILHQNGDGDLVLNQDVVLDEAGNLYDDGEIVLTVAHGFAMALGDSMKSIAETKDAKIIPRHGKILFEFVSTATSALIEGRNFDASSRTINKAFDDFNRALGVLRLGDL